MFVLTCMIRRPITELNAILVGMGALRPHAKVDNCSQLLTWELASMEEVEEVEEYMERWLPEKGVIWGLE